MNRFQLEFKHGIDAYLSEELDGITADLDEVRGGDTTRNSWFSQLLKTLPIPPAYTIVRVNDLSSNRDEVQQTLQDHINKQYDHKLCAPPTVVPHPLLQDVLVIPSGHLDRSKVNSGDRSEVKPESKEVIVDLACGMAVLRGAEIFAPGVMAAPVAMNRGDAVAVYSDVKGLCRRGSTTRFEGERLFLGNGRTKMSRHDIFVASSSPSGTAVIMTEPVFDCPSLNAVLPTKIFLQNVPSIVVGHVLNPQPGETVLDMCAAPGGKTTHIATLMKDQGTVVALDKASKKITRIEANANALNLNCIRAFCFDGTKACQPENANGTDDFSPPFCEMTFDRILLDAPCSGLGQRPMIYNKMSLSEVKSYPALQRKLFTSAVMLLREGGTLVYSTCTFTLAENEGLVAWAIKKHPEMRLERQEPYLGGPGLPVPGLSGEDRDKLQRFTPASHLAPSTQGCTPVTCDNDTIGFFVAKFIKLTNR